MVLTVRHTAGLRSVRKDDGMPEMQKPGDSIKVKGKTDLITVICNRSKAASGTTFLQGPWQWLMDEFP